LLRAGLGVFGGLVDGEMGIHDESYGMESQEPGLEFSPNGELSHAAGCRRGFLRRFLFSTDHKTIGLQYLWLALLCVFLGMAMSLLMRVNLMWPEAGANFLRGFSKTPEHYAALTLLHGSLMVFFVLTAAPQAGLGNYLLPLQIGARETAFPHLNLLAVWLTAASAAGITASFFLAPERGVQLWVVGVAVFCLAALLVAINFSVTAIDLRGAGMALPRLPLTVWAWFINALLSVLIFSILLAACVLLLSDMWIGTRFFHTAFIDRGALGASGVAVVTWQRLFWFFAQAEVYVAMLPCFGIVTHLLATFARRPVWKERAVVLALCGVGAFGFCIWGGHMFATGMNPGMPMLFGVLALSLGVPASVLLLSWFATLWNGRLLWNTSALFVLGFISLFLSGCFSGLFLAREDIALLANGGDFVSGHFHLVMGVSATFAVLAALFFWFPKLFGRWLNEPLGKVHFWLTFVGVFCVFMPMHWMGLMGRARPGMDAAAARHGGVGTFITLAALVTVAAQGIFLFNLLETLWRGELVLECNPWRATTLEWTDRAVDGLRAFRGAYEFDESGSIDDFIPQYVAPDRVAYRQVSRSG
jgi:cytochrome c oxidase subunit I